MNKKSLSSIISLIIAILFSLFTFIIKIVSIIGILSLIPWLITLLIAFIFNIKSIDYKNNNSALVSAIFYLITFVLALPFGFWSFICAILQFITYLISNSHNNYVEK